MKETDPMTGGGSAGEAGCRAAGAAAGRPP